MLQIRKKQINLQVLRLWSKWLLKMITMYNPLDNEPNVYAGQSLLSNDGSGFDTSRK